MPYPGFKPASTAPQSASQSTIPDGWLPKYIITKKGKRLQLRFLSFNSLAVSPPTLVGGNTYDMVADEPWVETQQVSFQKNSQYVYLKNSFWFYNLLIKAIDTIRFRDQSVKRDRLVAHSCFI
ncbi:hypothetical protein TNCV_426491 [Trichonephila clavipes]|nr:hypothetical protein TNCV_426491 [Trichonephila clavipes]